MTLLHQSLCYLLGFFLFTGASWADEFPYEQLLLNKSQQKLQVYAYHNSDSWRLASCYKGILIPKQSVTRKQFRHCNAKQDLQLYVELVGKGKAARCHLRGLPRGPRWLLSLIDQPKAKCKVSVTFWRLPLPAMQIYSSAKPTQPFQYLTFQQGHVFPKKERLNTSLWYPSMKKLGARLKQAKVAMVVLVHGTFVGSDPFGFLDFSKNWFPSLNVRWLRRINKSTNDSLLGDLGNYTKLYRKSMQRGLGMPTVRFLWSSANYHLARVKGIIKLVRFLHNEVQVRRTPKGHRILLLGHSHAGQLFALLTHFLHATPTSRWVLPIGLPVSQHKAFLAKVKSLRTFHFDIVTFGTPPRYAWSKGRGYRLLNIINHRGRSYLGGTWKGVLSTKDGDYVQQWGIAGTDMMTVGDINRKNRQLDFLLGPGYDVFAFHRFAKHNMRVPHHGTTYLVDYKDNNTNSLKTLMGHGVYTRYHTMLFHMKLIANFFDKK